MISVFTVQLLPHCSKLKLWDYNKAKVSVAKQTAPPEIVITACERYHNYSVAVPQGLHRAQK